jgi:hypothetical protein
VLWKKPNGTEIETRDTDEVKEYCASLGWKPADEKPRRRPRAQAASDDAADEGGAD